MSEKKLTGTKILMVIAPEQFRDEELLEPKKIFEQAGAQVVVASTLKGKATGMLGATVHADISLDDAKSPEYKAIVVVGGMGSPEHLWKNTRLHGLLRECSQKGNVVAGICLSGAVLANAGVLAAKKATVWATPESLQALEKGKARYTQEHVVSDGNVVTADGPEAAAEFGSAVATALQRVASKV